MASEAYQTAILRLVRQGREYFYHTDGRGYVDLDDLLDMQYEGEPFKIYDEETGSDVTQVLLA